MTSPASKDPPAESSEWTDAHVPSGTGGSDLPPPIRTERPPPDAGRYALVKQVSGMRRAVKSSRLRVMVVEDDPWVGGCMLEVLSEAGHDVTLVHTLAEARLQLATTPPDVLTLDLQLAGELGTELLEDLREASNGPAIVIVSAYRSIEAVADRYQVPFVRKPFDIEHLVAAVGKVASRAATG